MDYQESFKKRAHMYLQAMNEFGNVLDNEFITAVNMLELKPRDVILNIPAGGVPIDLYIDASLNVTYIPYDTHEEFSSNDVKYCTWDNIPLENNTIDKILCLASFHHLNEQERMSAYKEFQRLLKPDGKLIIGDVLYGSDQALWLDTFVDTFNSNGHKGNFFTTRDTHLIEKAGFNVTTCIQSYDWMFKSKREALSFCKLLFGLDLINITDKMFSDAIENILHYSDGRIPWKLIYFVCCPQ
jgi:SAM-dependent methyltransferase